MELREAIEHAEQKAQDLNCSCREDHGQLAQWLTELEKRREKDCDIIAVLQPLAPSLSIVEALLTDNGFENVSSKVLGIRSRIDFAIARLKEKVSED